jgi:hypothetical protein
MTRGTRHSPNNKETVHNNTFHFYSQLWNRIPNSYKLQSRAAAHKKKSNYCRISTTTTKKKVEGKKRRRNKKVEGKKSRREGKKK